MSCEIKSESKLQSVQWYKGNVPVNAALSEKDSEFDNTIQSILTMNDFKESDIGVYTCEAHNEVGSSTSDSIQVVYGNITCIDCRKQKIEIKQYGERIELYCKITSEYAIQVVQWYKEEYPVCCKNNQKYETINIKSPVLVINDIQESDIGEYSCEVDNIKGRTRSEHIQVVYALPVLTVETKKIEILRYGTRIELSCKTISESSITLVQWYKEEQPIHCETNEKYSERDIKSPELVIKMTYRKVTSGYIHVRTSEKYTTSDGRSHILTINDIQESDIGEYSCEVYNVKGCTWSEPIQVVYEKDDDLIKLISQVYTVKKLNEEKTADENISDFVQVPISNSADDSESRLDWNSARRTTNTDEKQTKVSMVATYDREAYDTETKRAINNVQEETISKRINHEKEELLTSSDIDEYFVDTKTKEKEEKDEKKIKDNVNEEIGKNDENEDNEETDKK
ncbi:TTN [Mytilus edulis]|uniref:TTN n=1 Tax=Mytilus edulis TaxID=6550 RepID=A0A8S3TEW6_MYTED|nr:TTN [Mytilus edulis]